MEVIQDKGLPVKMWTDGVYVEDEAKKQLLNISKMPFIYKWVAAMPDCHLGMGATVGSVVATNKAIIPAAVGVDIGCVDKDTEFLSPKGWVRISKYSGEKVMEYCPDTGTSRFVAPDDYIKRSSSKLYHIRTKYGIDQMVSPDHRMLVYKYDRSYKFDKYVVTTAEDLVTDHRRLKLGYRHRINTVFSPTIQTELGVTDEELRVVVMACADGSIPRKTNTCYVRVKKMRKIKRARMLLTHAKIDYEEKSKDGVTSFKFRTPIRTKSLGSLWGASASQLKVIVDECIHWDGNAKGRVFYSKCKDSADFIQYAGSASGYRSVLTKDIREHGTDYRVFLNENTKIGICGHPSKVEITEVVPEDGMEYCFKVPSGFFIARRNGRVFITGNCGMVAVKTSLSASDLPDSLARLRSDIESSVPHGRTDNGKRGKDQGSWTNLCPEIVQNKWKGLLDARYDRMVSSYPNLLDVNDINHLGTLGTGNHFIEICLDESNAVWIMLHSGSRGVGNAIGRTFIELAQKDMQRFFVNLPDKDLAYLPEGTDHFDDYINAVSWAQDFAKANREIMLNAVVTSMLGSNGVPAFTLEDEAINCHHNYVSREHHYGNNVLVTRKGAVRARKGELGIIPGCFAAGTRVLKANGLYCNIESLVPGEEIIDGTGSSTVVKAVISNGVKSTVAHRHLNWAGVTVCTPDHLYRSIDAKGYTGKESRIKFIKRVGKNFEWKAVSDTASPSWLTFPRASRLKATPFSIDISEYYTDLKSPHLVKVGYELGYVFGMYLGDGSSQVNSKGGITHWALGINEDRARQKLHKCFKVVSGLDLVTRNHEDKGHTRETLYNVAWSRLFKRFGKRSNKHLPEEFWDASNHSYLLGVLEGLGDSDGHLQEGILKFTNTSPVLIEQYSIIHYILFGYIPSISTRPPSAGALDNIDINNCLVSYRCGSLKHPDRVYVDGYQIISRYEIDPFEPVEVYDIEVESEDHSFIANGAVVHNSMGAKSFIVEGKGNDESFHSCSHGAGRLMSRAAAKKKFTVKDHEEATSGVECRKDEGVIDETPKAYKDIEAVMKAQEPLVSIKHTLKQILCVKG